MKKTIQKNSLSIALIGLATAGITSWSNMKVEEEKTKREQNEIFFSNYQDEIHCKMIRYDSLLAINHCY